MRRVFIQTFFSVSAFFLSACGLPAEGVLPERTVTATIEFTEIVPTPGSPPAETAVFPEMTATNEIPAASQIAMPLLDPVLDVFPAVLVRETGVQYTSTRGIAELVSDYISVLAANNCSPAAETAGENGTSTLFLCTPASGDFEDMTVSASESPFGTSVSIDLGYPAPARFEMPVPDGAEDIMLTESGGAFSLPSESGFWGDYPFSLEALGCRESNSVGSPEGMFAFLLICVDETGAALNTLSVLVSAEDDPARITVTAEPLFPNMSVVSFPDGVADIFFYPDSTIEYFTSIPFAGVGDFYRDPGMTFGNADCVLVEETGIEAGSTALLYLCTDYYSADVAYNYLVMVTISGTGTRTSVRITFVTDELQTRRP